MTTSLKTCFKCEEDKPRSEFYKHSEMADGLLGKCKDCTRKDAKEHRANNIEKIRAYDRSRGCRQTKEYRDSYVARFPKKYFAQNAVGNAVRDGRLTRGSTCEECGSTESIHGHHDDYDKPLEVRWLCAACHHQWHAENGEAKNGRNDEEAA